MNLWIILIFLSYSAWSQDNSVCIPIVKDPLADFKDLHKHLEWHGATTSQIENAFCKTSKPPTSGDLDKIIKSKSTGTTNAEINGVSFTGESPLLIEAFTVLTTAKDGFGITPKLSLQQDFQKTYAINPGCKKVLCAMEKIWGKNLSEKILYLNLKHSYNASEFAFENSDRFTEAEMDDVLMGIDDLPQHLTPMGSNNQRLTHFKRGYTLQAYGPNVAANAVIMLFDNWDTQTNRERQYSIFHEASHNTSSKLKNMDESPEWLSLSSWIKTGDTWTSDPKACQITKYGETNPWEDFAESMSTYRYNPQDFKSRCPDKYSFLKEKVFKGIEYTDLKSCSAIPEDKLKVAQEFIINDISESLEERTYTKEEVLKTCTNTFSYPPMMEELDSCSLKLTASAQANAEQRITEALQEANIPDIEANRELVLRGMNEIIANNNELKIQMIKMAKGIPEAIEAIKLETIQVANEISSGAKKLEYDSYLWRANQESCISQVLNTVTRDQLARCHLKTIINKDKESQRWGTGHFAAFKLSPIFKAESLKILEDDRDKDLENKLLNQETTKKAMLKIETDIKENLASHLIHVSVLLYNIPKWKHLSPEEFCSQTYSKSSSSFLNLKVKEGSHMTSVHDWCVNKQSQNKRRYEFSGDEWKEYTSSLFK